ncbi:MAG: hypothetical protein ACRC2V_09910 [Xenococcaceae cyanobacterium]
MGRKTDHLTPFPRFIDGNEPCARKPIQIKVPESQYEAWMALPAEVRNSALREAIAKILQENYEAIAS